METLLMAEHHRNPDYGRSDGGQISDRFVGSLPSRSFTNIVCRTFQSSGGIKSPRCYSEPPKPIKRSSSNPISITNPKQSHKSLYKKFTWKDDTKACSEHWAGPAYSNSPPPSSLPMPKFSLLQKRSVSLDLPQISNAVIDLRPVAKSAPSSPMREWSPPPVGGDGFFTSTASATENLRRILHLND